ncbi:MAG: 1-aminocyclopropane-1-carboxylate deaminase/D-cysteine desulfhydrase [Coriobacteriia bacterium]
MSRFLLAEAFPGLAQLPRAGIATLPTRYEVVRYESDAGMLALFVKREDLSSELYGGNKVRKLDLLLGEALAEKRRSVITIGPYASTHLLATAIHAKALGLEPHVIMMPQVPAPFAEEALLAHAAIGTCVHLARDEAEASLVALDLAEKLLHRDGREPYAIPIGGSSPLSAIGYVNAAYELLDQARAFAWSTLGGLPRLLDRTMDFGNLYVPAGSLGTCIGLAIGFESMGKPYDITAVRAVPGPREEVERRAEALVEETVALLRSYDRSFPEVRYEDLRLTFSDDALGTYFAEPTAEALRAVEDARKLGLALETTYSGKALAALDMHLRSKRVDRELVLFIDTYNSAVLPSGPIERLPEPLQEYVRQCREQYGGRAPEA